MTPCHVQGASKLCIQREGVRQIEVERSGDVFFSCFRWTYRKRAVETYVYTMTIFLVSLIVNRELSVLVDEQMVFCRRLPTAFLVLSKHASVCMYTPHITCLYVNAAFANEEEEEAYTCAVRHTQRLTSACTSLPCVYEN